jgi:hypothetical protein
MSHENDVCSAVRLDNLQAKPDKQDALCLLSILDWSDPNKVLTKPDLATMAKDQPANTTQAAALQRLSTNMQDVGHKIGQHSVDDPPALLIIGSTLMYMAQSHKETDYGVSRIELERLTKTP